MNTLLSALKIDLMWSGATRNLEMSILQVKKESFNFLSTLEIALTIDSKNVWINDTVLHLGLFSILRTFLLITDRNRMCLTVFDSEVITKYCERYLTSVMSLGEYLTGTVSDLCYSTVFCPFEICYALSQHHLFEKPEIRICWLKRRCKRRNRI